jgi:hypothetical protein
MGLAFGRIGEPWCELWRSLLSGGFSVALAAQNCCKSRVEAGKSPESDRKTGNRLRETT